MAFLGGQTYLQGRPAREGDSSTFFAAGQGGAAAASAPWVRSGLQKQCGPDTRSARGELMESPRSCPTRLCRADGSPQHSVETPPGRPDRASHSEARPPQNTAVQDWQPAGSKSSADTQRWWKYLRSTRDVCRIATNGPPSCQQQRMATQTA